MTGGFQTAQAIGLRTDEYANIFTSLGIVRVAGSRVVEAVAAFREAVLISDRAGDGVLHGVAQLNLSDALMLQGLWAQSADAAELAIASLRRTGSSLWAFATGNLLQALLLAGRWDSAADVIAAAAIDGGASDPYFSWCATMLRALRGDPVSPELMDTIHTLAASEDPQDKATIAITHCFTTAGAGDLRAASAAAKVAIATGEQVGVGSEAIRWCWPVAADLALELDDIDEVELLLAWADNHPDGHLHPVVRADRFRVRARLAAVRGDEAAAGLLDTAIVSLRALESPYHLAIGLADQAAYLASVGDHERAERSRDEATLIGESLGAKPLLSRIAGVSVR